MCDGQQHTGDLPHAIRDLADEYERGAMFRTGQGIAKRLRDLLDRSRPASPAPVIGGEESER
jgi:hypothetical protein